MKTCKTCGNDFNSTSEVPFCDDCSLRFKFINICVLCGELFQTNREYAKYCSKPCRIKGNLKEKSEWVCFWCKRRFKSVRKRKYCSEECKNSHNKTKKEKPKMVEEPIKEVKQKRGRKKKNRSKCLNCGNASEHKFCSTDCRIKFESKTIVQQTKISMLEDEPIGEIAEFNGRTLNFWLVDGFGDGLKEQVKQRDGYECFICGAETNLHVHHIVPRKEGGTHSPNNLVTLCGTCHGLVERGNIDKAIKRCTERAVMNAKKRFDEE